MEIPQSADTVLILAFDGWNDAGSAATTAIAHLSAFFPSQPAAAIEPDDFYDFQASRPTLQNVAAGRQLTWPTTRFVHCTPAEGGRRLVLGHGPEPNLRWRAFAGEVLQVARALQVDLVVCLGSLLTDTPHSRPVPVTGSASHPGLAAAVGLEPSSYEGPTGIVGVLAQELSAAGLPTVSFWAGVPHYVAQSPCPKATVALLRRLEDLLDQPIPLGELPEQARLWEQQVDELAAEDEEVRAYIGSLEEREPETELPEASGEAIAQEFQRFLRREDEPPRD